MSKSKPAAAAPTTPAAAAATTAIDPATDRAIDTTHDTAAGAPFTAEQLAAIDERIAGHAETYGAALGAELKRMIVEEREKVLGELDEKGAALLKAAREMPLPAKPAAPVADAMPDRILSAGELARTVTTLGIDLHPERIMTDDEGRPAYAVRDGVLSVTTVDGRRIEVAL